MLAATAMSCNGQDGRADRTTDGRVDRWREGGFLLSHATVAQVDSAADPRTRQEALVAADPRTRQEALVAAAPPPVASVTPASSMSAARRNSAARWQQEKDAREAQVRPGHNCVRQNYTGANCMHHNCLVMT